MKRLLVEDGPASLASVVSYLQARRYICEVATTYARAQEKKLVHDHAHIVLDLTLPGGGVRVVLAPQQLFVENTGRPQALPAQLFVRFRPGPGRAPGSVGLSPAIARQIYKTYGFLLSYHYEEPGHHQMRGRLG